jgi:hypothetical protein
MNKILIFLKGLWNFFNSKVFLYIIIIVAALWMLNTCRNNANLKNQQIIDKQNISALSDTVKTVKNKAGELQQEKLSYIAKNKELKEINLNLYNEVKKQKGTVIFLTTANGQLKSNIDQLEKENKSLKDSLGITIVDGDTINSLNWDFSAKYDTNNYRNIKGKTKFKINNNTVISLGSELNTFDVGFNLSTGLKEEKGLLNIWIKSDYPNLTFPVIEGSVVDPKESDAFKALFPQHKWTFGPQLGLGVGYSKGLLSPSIYVGFGAQYTLFGF